MEPTDKKNTAFFSKQVGEKEKRKLKSLKEDKKNVLFGLGMFGMVGWSVTVPTLLGAAAGIWLDKEYPQTFSWTLTLLILGLFLGCINAWKWIDKENEKINQDKKEKDE